MARCQFAQSVCGLREFKPSVSSAVRPSGRGVASPRETGIRWNNAARRLIRADRCRILRRALIRCCA